MEYKEENIAFADGLKFDEKGLIPAVTQNFRNKEVLMVGYMNKESLLLTLETGKVHYFSRSRQSLWLKGETSGHFQFVKNIRYDCDMDTLLISVEQVGSACHTGNTSCFYRSFSGGKHIENEKVAKDGLGSSGILDDVYNVIMNRKENPKEGSYTNYLFDKGIDKILKKIGEEATEIVVAAKNNNNDEVALEVADLLYHISVMLAEKGMSWKDIYSELENRR